MKKIKIYFHYFSLAALVLGLGGAFSALAKSEKLSLTGAGATFPYPLYSKWFAEYNKLNPQVEINYQSIGSGGGIKNLLDHTVDFGASDAYMSDEQLTKAGAQIVHIPTILGAVVVTYNLPEIKQPLRFTGPVVADIFLGKIKKWNDPAIVSNNPGVTLPATDILVVHRSDGSGTTAVFGDYLSKVSPEWKTKVGSETSLPWPVGLGGKGNEGVTGLLTQTKGAIGYTELVYAEKNKLPVAEIKNQAGSFVKPTVSAVSAAAAAFQSKLPDDLRLKITDPAGAKDAYPISSFTYLLVYAKTEDSKSDPKEREALKAFIEWSMKKGQAMAAELSYAPLPKQVVDKVSKRLALIGTTK